MKLYTEMTRAEKLRYRTEMVAAWIKAGTVFPLVSLTRKVKNSDGWHWTSDWCWKDCEGGLKPIDIDLLYKSLGIVESKSRTNLAYNMRQAGIDIINLDWVIVINANA